jgi:hypothetical protein
LTCRSGKVAVFTTDGRLLLVDATTGDASVLADGLSKPARHQLSDAARTCERSTVFSDWPDGVDGGSEIALARAGDDRTPRYVTVGAALTFKSEPAFSADCGRIVFVASTSSAPAPESTMPPAPPVQAPVTAPSAEKSAAPASSPATVSPPPRGCVCGVPAMGDGRSARGALVSAAVLVGAAVRRRGKPPRAAPLARPRRRG